MFKNIVRSAKYGAKHPMTTVGIIAFLVVVRLLTGMFFTIRETAEGLVWIASISVGISLVWRLFILVVVALRDDYAEIFAKISANWFAKLLGSISTGLLTASCFGTLRFLPPGNNWMSASAAFVTFVVLVLAGLNAFAEAEKKVSTEQVERPIEKSVYAKAAWGLIKTHVLMYVLIVAPAILA